MTPVRRRVGCVDSGLDPGNTHHIVSNYLGTVNEIAFESFEEIEALFEGELQLLLKRGSS